MLDQFPNGVEEAIKGAEALYEMFTKEYLSTQRSLHPDLDFTQMSNHVDRDHGLR